MEDLQVGDAVRVNYPGYGYASHGDIGVIEEIEKGGIVRVRFQRDYILMDRRFSNRSSLEKLEGV